MRTVLFDQHQALGAKIVDFCGWEMPVLYKGIIQEHLAVRKSVGIFDVSHMGRICVEGPQAEAFLDYLSTNLIVGKPNGSATYTVFCRENGTCVDDLIVYKQSPEKFFLIVNAGNRQKDLLHLQEHAKNWNVHIKDKFHDEGILAIQGPKALEVVNQVIPGVDSLSPMTFAQFSFNTTPVIVAATGYTGAGGVEIYAPLNVIPHLWNQILQVGGSYGIEPVGLGARDTLRLEMGYALYGHELTDEISAIESVSSWTIKLKKPNFLGKAALEKLMQSGNARHEYGVVLEGKAIAREGYPVFKNNERIGVITSGTFSPSLNQPIAIVLVERKLENNDSVDIQIRSNMCSAKITKLPFLKSPSEAS